VVGTLLLLAGWPGVVHAQRQPPKPRGNPQGRPAKPPPKQSAKQPPTQPDRSAFPILADSDSVHRAKVLRALGPEMQRLGFMKWAVPEYHDEQRFVVWPAGMTPDPLMPPAKAATARYGPTVRLFASPYLDDFRKEWQIDEQEQRKVLVAIAHVEDDAGGTGPLPAPYVALQLQRGINCLWLVHDPSGRWKGEISTVDAAQTCSRKLPSLEYKDLRVDRVTDASYTSFDDYPPVARIGETTTGQPLLGMKCLDAWCEFGPPGPWQSMSTPPAPMSVATSTGTGTSLPRQARIRGWYDQQWLATRDASGTLRPLLYASIVPDEGIAERSASFYSSVQHVASVVLYVDPPTDSKYAQWGLHKGVNDVFVFNDPAAGWRVHVGPVVPGDHRWLKAERMVHDDAGVPGTARWRYTLLDDSMWVPCGQACCRVYDRL
jgi:hypothetical protein